MKYYHLPDSESEEDDEQSCTTAEDLDVAEVTDPDGSQEGAKEQPKAVAEPLLVKARKGRMRRTPRWLSDYEF